MAHLVWVGSLLGLSKTHIHPSTTIRHWEPAPIPHWVSSIDATPSHEIPVIPSTTDHPSLLVRTLPAMVGHSYFFLSYPFYLYLSFLFLSCHVPCLYQHSGDFRGGLYLGPYHALIPCPSPAQDPPSHPEVRCLWTPLVGHRYSVFFSLLVSPHVPLQENLELAHQRPLPTLEAQPQEESPPLGKSHL